jgi:purine-nucleoside phosphorylase
MSEHGRFGAADARAAAEAIRARLPRTQPVAAIVLGSGLGGLAHQIADPVRVPYGEIPGFPGATVPGHAGELIAGTLAGKPVLALAGRFHLYEGHDVRLAACPARVVHALGARTLIVSNAAGGVNPGFVAGDLMLIRDHINLMFRNPLIGALEEGDVRFPDMSNAYDRELGDAAAALATELGLNLREGVYAALLGPTYETAAEVKMLGIVGADAVGMSTVPEVIVARAIGMRVLGVSCITNLACGLTPEPITHAEVLESTARAAAGFQSLIAAVVARL